MTKGLVGWKHNNTASNYTFYYNKMDSYPKELGRKFINWVIQSTRDINQFSELVRMNLDIGNKEFDGNFDFKILDTSSTLYDYIYILDLDNDSIKLGRGKYKHNSIVATDKWYGMDTEEKFKKEYTFTTIPLSQCLKLKWDWREIFTSVGYPIT